MAGPEKKAVVVGISGASSSGKTTISRLLRDIFPNSFVLHEDDFYKPEKDLPVNDGLVDWDSADSLSIPDIVASLDHIQRNGEFPPNFDSNQDRNSVGKVPVSDSLITELKARVMEWTQPGHHGHGILTGSSNTLKLCIFDGFLLYCPPLAPVQPHIDIKLFLRVSYAHAKSRREDRDGYATLEGWWKDPPGYVDKIVWPNYVKNHEWMFEDGNVEGKFKEGVLEEWHIHTQHDKGVDVDLETTLIWAVETLMKELERLAVDIKGAGHVHKT